MLNFKSFQISVSLHCWARIQQAWSHWLWNSLSLTVNNIFHITVYIYITLIHLIIVATGSKWPGILVILICFYYFQECIKMDIVWNIFGENCKGNYWYLIMAVSPARVDTLGEYDIAVKAWKLKVQELESENKCQLCLQPFIFWFQFLEFQLPCLYSCIILP